MPNVNYIRDEVKRLFARWDLVRDCISGQEQIKRHGTKYLPQPDPSNKSEENKARYEAYKQRAIFYNVTGRTEKGLVGHVFAKDPVLTIPPALDFVKNDIDGAGVSLDQQAGKATGMVVSFGRAGLLTDYPTTAGSLSKAEAESLNIRPTVTLIAPQDIINWRVATVGAKTLLTLVVICERATIDDDGFEAKHDEQWRELRLEGGIYQVRLWRSSIDAKTKETTYTLHQEFTPTDGKGQPFNEILFSFIGSENNDASCDNPPLYDMAVLNIGHYVNSADYEESVYMVGQPTPVCAGLDEDWATRVLGSKVHLGSRAAIMLPEGGTATLLQAEPNIMPREAMQDKERQMVAMGAKLVQQSEVQRTATEAGQEEASETSMLSKAAKNVSAAYSKALNWCAQFLGNETKEGDENAISYQLNSKFEITAADSSTLSAMLTLFQGNAISLEEFRDYLIRAEIAYQDIEEFKDAIESAGPSMGLPVEQKKLDDSDEAARQSAEALKNKSKTTPAAK